MNTSTFCGLMSPCTISMHESVVLYCARISLNHLRDECITISAVATSAQSFNLSSKHILFPTLELRNWFISPYSVFSNTRTGQTFSSSTEISQHIPSSVTTFVWFRIAGWPSIETSEISVRYRDSSDIVERVLRLNTKLLCRFISDWRISAVPPMPNKSKACCHVMGRKPIPKRWATAKKEMKS